MIAVIGLGQAGSNIAEEASNSRFLTGAINYSQRDLDSVNVKHKLRLLGSEGVGKKRNEAIELFQDQWETALSFVRDYFSNSKVIIFTFSTSGGSGSGISPILLEVCQNSFPDTTFVAMPIIPEITESQTSQINCLNTFAELSKLDIAVFPIDNQQARNTHGLAGKNKIFEITNQSSISYLSKLVSYTTKHSKNGNFDEQDLITVLATPGIATISECEIATLSSNILPQGVSTKIVQSWESSIFAPVSSKRIERAAIIFDGQDTLMEYVQHNLIFQDFMPELFEGNYHESNGRVTSLLTGLPWSFKRLLDIQESLKIYKDQQEAIGSTNEILFTPTTSVATLPKKAEKKSVLDILNKYKY
ncbi:hypothetical protein [Paenibacillus sp. Marseille-Q4541]|uniref:hypothetical protein n=1 Tax=Paenibacillus sp. Marseille-Q4541 TaxID=2831522 RepID=UPI001BA67FD6|nr:hypothetical protein [Paenibacillus sp. Marseille-Q4541]